MEKINQRWIETCSKTCCVFPSPFSSFKCLAAIHGTIEQETKAVMRQIASIPKQNQYIDQLFLQLEEEKALNTQQHNNQQLQQDTKTEETNNLQN